jgi:hypothetical protein
LVKHHTYKLHASAAFIALEDIDFECPFEKLCPGDALSFAQFLIFA